MFQGRFCVQDLYGLRGQILEEAHCSRYSIYSGATNMHYDIQEVIS